jgi:hypothetical protein
MTLQFSTETNETQEILDRIRSLCLACKIESAPHFGNIILIEGKNRAIGIQAILSHIEEIESELFQWDSCGCET